MSDCEIIPPDAFDWQWFDRIKPQKAKRGNQGTRQWRRYLNIVTAFDIETTGLPDIEQSIMYVWQWQFGDRCTVMGRTWDQYRAFVAELGQHIKGRNSLVVLVHNLSYEFQFLTGVFDFSPKDVFCIQSRKILKCMALDNHLEFRCTYLHSNMSLAKYCKNMGVEHGKLSGAEFDYSKIRYSWTPLTDYEMHYCQNDVLGLVEAYTAEMRKERDTLSSVPMTSTGYVRRDAKRAMRLASSRAIKNIAPDLEVYVALRKAFRGGDTHANRYITGQIINNVSSADRSSSYPDVICNGEYPMQPFYRAQHQTIDALLQSAERNALLIHIGFYGIRQSDPYYGFPYIPFAKCESVAGALRDNGRILKAAYLETWITDIDLKIILEQYSYEDYQILDCWQSQYGALPAPLILTVQEYYRKKTALKGGDPEQEYYYIKSKNKLNSCYGMMAQDPGKETIQYIQGAEDPYQVKLQELGEILQKYTKNAFLVYQWGVWVTAWARLRLYDGIRLAYDQGALPVYCDTDSVKYTGVADWSAYNRQRRRDSIDSGSFADDIKGQRHYMGVYEDDGHYDRFITLGAKKYAYEDGGKLHITVAGVGKTTGAQELAKAGGLEAFREGFVFRDAGGLESVYNDRHGGRIRRDGGEIEVVPNVYLKPSTYTLSLTDEYRDIVADAVLFDRLRQIN